jgi:hypothetical protein
MEARAGSLGEAARRLLKCENARLVVPIEIISEAQILALKISDELPSIVHEPKVELGAEENSIRVWSPKGLLVALGGSAQNLDIVWVPIGRNELENVWHSFEQIVSDLLSVGYPGCIDCAGPAATEPWDEAQSRLRF